MKIAGICLLVLFSALMVEDPVAFFVFHFPNHAGAWHVFHHVLFPCVLAATAFLTWRWLVREEN